MGQAKQRGSLEERQAAARAEVEQRPDKVHCEKCDHEITDIRLVPAHERCGLDLAFNAQCSRCRHTTYLLKGSQ